MLFCVRRKQFPGMRPFIACLLAVAAATANLNAGRLDVAVIQFPEDKTPEGLASALAGANLFDITDSNRTMTSEPYLKGGYVIFAQSMPASAGSKFSTATRLRNERVDVEGQLGSGTVSVTISVTEGVKAGLRSFEKSVYTGSGPLSAGSPQVLSIRQIRGKAPRVEKGQSKMATYNLTTVVVAQYTP